MLNDRTRRMWTVECLRRHHLRCDAIRFPLERVMAVADTETSVS